MKSNAEDKSGSKVRQAYFMIPFQLSPVAIRNKVRKAIPKFWFDDETKKKIRNFCLVTKSKLNGAFGQKIFT